MGDTFMTIKTAAKAATVATICTLGITILASGNVYAQTANQNQTGDASWLWWLLPLAALGILFFILRRSLQSQRDDYQERFGFGDQTQMAGLKGGQVKRNRTDEDEMELEDDLEEGLDDQNARRKTDPWDRTKDDWNL